MKVNSREKALPHFDLSAPANASFRQRARICRRTFTKEERQGKKKVGY